MKIRKRIAVLPAVLGLALAASGCGGGSGGTPKSLLLVTVTGTPADAAGCQGNAAARTPAWDRTARRGAQFRDARAPGAAASASCATVLSGVPPGEHGLDPSGSGTYAPPRLTLPEAMLRAGMRTAAFVADPEVAAAGLSRGFERLDVPGPATAHTPGAVAGEAAAWIGALGPEDRWFVWLQLTLPDGSPRSEIDGADRAVADLVRRLGADGRLGQTMVLVHGTASADAARAAATTAVTAEPRVPLAVWGPLPFRGGAIRPDPAHLVDLMPTLIAAFRIGPDWRLPGRVLDEIEFPEEEAHAASS